MKTKALLIVSLLLASSVAPALAREVVTDTLELDKGLALTPASILQGRVSGLRVSAYEGSPNGATASYIRGVNALRGDSQPLWIVDGTIINASLTQNNKAFWQYAEEGYTSPVNALSFINPYDIEKIEVVKNLSAAAIYGSRGANGAIIVTTKSGSGDGFRVSARSNIGLSNPVEDVTAARQGISHNHYINLTGVEGQTVYALSGYLRKTEGIFAGDDSFYGGLRASFDTRANKTLWFGMSTILTMGKMNSIASTSYFGNPSLTMSILRPRVFKADPLSGWEADYDDESVERRLTASTYLTINIGKYVKWNNTVGVDFLNNNRYIWYGNGISFGADNNGAASVVGTSMFKYNANSELSWDQVFAVKHHLTARLAAEASGDWNKFNVLNGTDFFSHVLRARGVSLKASAAAPHKYDYNYNTLGAYAGLSYDYDGIAGAHILYRADNTPRYDDGRLRSYKSGEAFVDLHGILFPEGKTVSALRLSAGYGEAGREQFVPYGLYGDYLSGEYPVADPALEPFYEGLNRVTSRELNIGATLGLFSDRLTLHAAYYDKKSDDAFYGYYFGTPESGHYIKYGERQDEFDLSSRIANRGIEGDLDATVLDNGQVKWTLSANLARNVNQMLRVDALDAYGRSIGSGTVINANVVGRQVGALYGYTLGEDRRFVDATRDGKLDDFDKDIIGNPIPEWTGGLGSTLTVGRFTADVLFDGAAGFDILNLNKLLVRDVTPYNVSEREVERGDYLRLSRLSLSYDINMQRVKWIRGLSVNASANNLLMCARYSGWNPTVNCFGTSALTNGADYGSYPLVRSFVFGVNVNF